MDDKLDSLLERGWGKMSTTLDKEMPIKKSGRLNWQKKFLSAVLLFLIVAATIQIGFNPNTENSGYSAQSGKIASIDFTKQRNSSENIEIQSPINQKFNNHHKKTSITEIVMDPGSDEYINKVVFGKNFSSELHRQEESLVAHLPALMSMVEPGGNKIILLIETNHSDYSSKQSVKKENEFPKTSDFKHNVLSVSLNSVNQNLTSFEGLDGGLNYSYKLNKNFGFITGIEHSLYTYSKFDYDLGILQQAVYRDKNDNREADFSMQTQESKNNNKMHYYLGIPVGLLYSIDKFTVSAGIKLSYLLNSMEDPEFDSGENQKVMALIMTGTQQNEPVYNRFDYSFIFGFEFHILKDLSVFSRLNYAQSRIVSSYSYNQNTLGDLFLVSGLENEKEKPDKNIYFGLGIKYDLARK